MTPHSLAVAPATSPDPDRGIELRIQVTDQFAAFRVTGADKGDLGRESLPVAYGDVVHGMKTVCYPEREVSQLLPIDRTELLKGTFAGNQ